MKNATVAAGAAPTLRCRICKREIAPSRTGWVTFKRSIGEQEVIELARQRKAPELESGTVDAARTVLEDIGGILLDDEP